MATKTWEGIRCRRCGAFLKAGKCPVNRTDCKGNGPWTRKEAN